MCSERSTAALDPSTARNRSSSVAQKPWQAAAAAQIGQWFSIRNPKACGFMLRRLVWLTSNR
jgi:hypothetical protein